MFLQKRIINGKTYTYIQHSFRIGNKVEKASFILDKDKGDYNERIIEKIAKKRASYFYENFKTYFSFPEIIEIEKEKIFYQIFYNMLNKKRQTEIFDEYARLFLVNNMKLEGSTITPRLAEFIDKNKRTILPQSDIRLYNNSKNALSTATKIKLRSIIQFKRLHVEIYSDIYPHAGEFKQQTNTFGYMKKAQTTAPKEVKEQLKKILKLSKNNNLYPFQVY